MPYWCPFEWAPTLLMETNRNIEFYLVLLQKREFIPRGTHQRYNWSDSFSNAGCSLGVGDQRILCLLHWILQLMVNSLITIFYSDG